MAGVNKRTNRLVVFIGDLDSTIKDITFDCFVLNRYGNYDKTAPFNYLHAGMIDIHGVCTATVTIVGSLINFHKDKFTIGNHLRIENFTLRIRANFERGDLDLFLQYSVWISLITVCIFFMRTLLHLLTRGFMISGQWHQLMLLYGSKEVDGCFELIVVDGDALEDVQMVCIQTFWHCISCNLFSFSLPYKILNLHALCNVCK